MKQSRFSKLKNQHGDILIESMIGMVLMAIISMGMIHVSSRAAVAQKDMRMQEIVVNQLRATLIQNKMGAIDICNAVDDIQLPNGLSLTVDVQGCGGGINANVNGTNIPGIPTPISLSVDHESIGGRIAVGGTWAA